MNEMLKLLSAVLPGILLLVYILWNDRKNHEPWQQIVKGIVCGFISYGILRLFWKYLPDYFEWTAIHDTIIEKVRFAFLYAAIPEEISKLIILWVTLSGNMFYNEERDGIIYAVCIGLGFATLENIDCFSGYEPLNMISLKRALVSVPAHYLFALLMGYYYSNAHFWPSIGLNRFWQLARIILIPILMHGTFDSMAFIISWSKVGFYVFAAIFIIVVCWINHQCNKLTCKF